MLCCRTTCWTFDDLSICRLPVKCSHIFLHILTFPDFVFFLKSWPILILSFLILVSIKCYKVSDTEGQRWPLYSNIKVFVQLILAKSTKWVILKSNGSFHICPSWLQFLMGVATSVVFNHVFGQVSSYLIFHICVSKWWGDNLQSFQFCNTFNIWLPWWLADAFPK